MFITEVVLKPKYDAVVEEANILRDFLVMLHTSRWTGNNEHFKLLLERLAAYSYSLTNSNGYYDEEEIHQQHCLENLTKPFK